MCVGLSKNCVCLSKKFGDGMQRKAQRQRRRKASELDKNSQQTLDLFPMLPHIWPSFGVIKNRKLINPFSQGGVNSVPIQEIPEGVVLGPMLLFIIWTYLEIERTCKKLGKNLKN